MAYTSSQTSKVFIVVALICAFVPAFSVEEAEAKSLWDTCLLKISPKCALDIIGVVFENLTITDACCHDLPHLVAHETEYLKKSDDLWTHCVSNSQTA
ncbi:BnaA09g22920D [Brassica napus]|uniref:(rape) hypothetical protein n=1 Tax=Brassica napus TaxID=3708 RepID=A0A078IIH3_BRANA|nr:unnamed protein product [Brassica napus]CDY48903.1 BnaA09g22920D [Brassica napus]